MCHFFVSHVSNLFIMNIMSKLKILLLSQDNHIQGILKLLIQTAIDALHADEGSLLIPTADKRNLEFIATVSPTNRDLSKDTIPIGTGISGMAALSRDVQIGSKPSTGLNNVTNDGDPESIIAAPLLANDELVGVMTIVRLKDKTPFSTQDAERFFRLATVGAVVIDQQQKLDGISEQVSESAPKSQEDEVCQTLATIIKDVSPSRLPILRRLLETICDLMQQP